MNNEYEAGLFSQGEDEYLEGVVEQGSTYDIYFSTTGSDPIYTYFNLYNFTDDLDLALYQYSENLNEYTQISTSEEEGNIDESIFKGLAKGDYVLEISHYSDLDYSEAASSFTINFDSVEFYANSILPNDPLFANQWHLLNTGQAGGIDDEDITAPEAWNIRSTSPDVVVAVIDGGIQYDHQDLDDNIWINSDEIYGNGIDDDNNGYVDDIYGWNFAASSNFPLADDHGSHVAGIIGAEGNNGIGIAGVTWDTQLMSLDVFDVKETYDDMDLLNAIYYAADNGADVINMSLGATYEYATLAEARISDPDEYYAYYEALTYAVDQGATIVIAAGNEDANASTHLSIPAAFSSVIDGVISVAAVANTGDLTDYSNYGSSVTIAAPGGSHDLGAGILSTVPRDMYEGMPGTSMASPIVAGAAALIKAENPNFTPADIESIITDSADKYREMSSLVEDGNFLNLKDALALAQTYQPSFTPTPEPTPTSGPTPTPEPTPTSGPTPTPEPTSPEVISEIDIPVNKKWSKHLWKKSGKDGIIDYYVDKKGKSDKKENTKITKKTLSFLDNMLDDTESPLGLVFNKVKRSKHADIVFQAKSESINVGTQKTKYGMEVSFFKTKKKPTQYDMQDINYLTGYALGLKDLQGENYDTTDSIMAGNYSDEYLGWSNNDMNALLSIW